MERRPSYTTLRHNPIFQSCLKASTLLNNNDDDDDDNDDDDDDDDDDACPSSEAIIWTQ